MNTPFQHFARILALIAPAATATAQDRSPTATSATDVSRAAADLGPTAFLTPIRAVASDQGVGGRLWASGAAYKAAFDDGVTFYPVLGPDAPDNLPLRWRTRAIGVGHGSVLGPLAVAQVHASEWRYELHRDGVIEAYDVRNDGVEQTFVLQARPTVAGDLVIVGAIESALRATPSAWQHGDIDFRDAQGVPRVRYGAATAIDARGRRCRMESSYDGSAISLRLSGQWLAEAAYPVVVDPLLASTTVVTHLAAISSFDVARDDVANQLMIVCRRASAGSDYDGFAFLVRDDFTAAGNTVFSDIEATWSTEHLSVAFVGGTDKWILALQRRFPSDNNTSYLRYRLHDSGDVAFDNTVTLVARPNLESWTAPDVGGSWAAGSGNQALIVFRVEYPVAAPWNADVYGMLVDTNANTIGARFSLSGTLSGPVFDRAAARVNKESGGSGSSWVAVFNELNRTDPNDDFDVCVVRVSTTGTVTPRITLPSASLDHKVTPSIDGRNGRYMLAYGLRASGHGNPWVHSVRARRFDFEEGAPAPTFGPDTLLAGAGDYYPTEIAYDSRTRSHWTTVWYDAAFDVFAARTGYDAGIGESVTVYDGPGSGSAPTVCFNDDARQFQIVHAAATGVLQVKARSLAYPTTSAVVQGLNCGGMISSDVPYAGSEFFTLRASSLQAYTAAVLLCALTPANLPLGFLDMPGCSLLVSPQTLLVTASTNAAAGGTAAVTLPLPTRVAGVDLYFQWAHIAVGANPANLLATPRLSVPVR